MRGRSRALATGADASGLATRQESISEAANAWYGISLYGLAAADARVRDLGRLMLGMELRAALGQNKMAIFICAAAGRHHAALKV